MKTKLAVLTGSLLAGVALAAEATLFQENFDSAEVGKVPAGMLVLDGGFAVREEAGNKLLELPGDPLDSYGILIGPALKDGATLTARVFGTAKGRRAPTFGIGLGGASGHRLVISPGKKEIELLKLDADLASAPFEWPSGKWLQLKLQIRPGANGGARIEGKAWTEGSPEPAAWTLTFDDPEAPRPGRPGLFGSPFAGTPIRYDDIVLKPLAP